MARHPLVLTGLVLGAISTGMALAELTAAPTADLLSVPVVALFVGVFAMAAAQLLTRSFDHAKELVQTTPTTPTTRSAALCLSAGVPAVLGSGWLIWYGLATGPVSTVPDWIYGPFSKLDILAVVAGQSVVAAVGGTLLGVAAGRWLRFRGATAGLVIVVVAWVMLMAGGFSSGGATPDWQRWTRLFSPFAFFSVGEINPVVVDSLTGSMWWYLLWLVTLCALAAVAALLKNAEPPGRRLLVRVGASLFVVSAVTYGLAAAGGLDHVVRTFPDGRSVILTR